MEMLKSRASDPTHAVFGKTPDGDTLALPLSDGPHWIIAGTTGSGKSVFANSLLVSMICHNTPDQLQLVWIDPKQVEAGAYVSLPYCPIDPVVDMGDAYGLIQYFCYEMDRRYALLAKTGVKKLSDYWQWIDDHPEEAEAGGHVKLPYIVCVIDEYADMVMQNKDVEDGIVRLAQKARAAGIHLLIMTQRPSAQVISPILKSNVPGRICLKVFDSTNSSIVIDEPGGEELLGYGDGLVKWNVGFQRVQGPFLSDEELANIFADLRKRYGSPEFLDYKQIVVDQDMCEWAEDYDSTTAPQERHVKPKKRRLGRL